jgi:hypothetical protein
MGLVRRHQVALRVLLILDGEEEIRSPDGRGLGIERISIEGCIRSNDIDCARSADKSRLAR